MEDVYHELGEERDRFSPDTINNEKFEFMLCRSMEEAFNISGSNLYLIFFCRINACHRLEALEQNP
jgi:hypothetical protein